MKSADKTNRRENRIFTFFCFTSVNVTSGGTRSLIFPLLFRLISLQIAMLLVLNRIPRTLEQRVEEMLRHVFLLKTLMKRIFRVRSIRLHAFNINKIQMIKKSSKEDILLRRKEKLNLATFEMKSRKSNLIAMSFYLPSYGVTLPVITRGYCLAK